jgi:hypothetical protein
VQKLVNRQAVDPVDLEALPAAVKQKGLALGVIRREAFQAAEIPGPHSGGVLDFDRPEAGISMK